MSRKKGYKKSLPSALPPQVRPPSPRAAAEGRGGPGSDAAPTAEPEPASEQPSEPAPEPAHEPAPEAVAPRVVAPRRSAATQLAARAVAPAPAAAPPRATAPPPSLSPTPTPPPPPPPPSSSRTRAVAIAAVVLLVGVGVGGLATWWLTRDDPAARQPPPVQAATGGWPPAGTSRTVTEVRADGTLRVTHRIHTTTPIDALDIALPETPSTEPVEATAVEVVADGRAAVGPDRVTFTRASYVFDDATTILVRYRLDGVVERSGSAQDRGLVTTTALDVSATQPDDIRVVRSASVLSLACATTTTALAPCGEQDRGGQWTVRLGADDAGGRVVAAVTVPS